MKPTHNIQLYFGSRMGGDNGGMTGTGEIVAVNFRYGFRGRPIAQVKRAHYRSEGVWPQTSRKWERSVGDHFRDATRDDLPELREFMQKHNEPVL